MPLILKNNNNLADTISLDQQPRDTITYSKKEEQSEPKQTVQQDTQTNQKETTSNVAHGIGTAASTAALNPAWSIPAGFVALVSNAVGNIIDPNTTWTQTGAEAATDALAMIPGVKAVRYLGKVGKLSRLADIKASAKEASKVRKVLTTSSKVATPVVVNYGISGFSNADYSNNNTWLGTVGSGVKQGGKEFVGDVKNTWTFLNDLNNSKNPDSTINWDNAASAQRLISTVGAAKNITRKPKSKKKTTTKSSNKTSSNDSNEEILERFNRTFPKGNAPYKKQGGKLNTLKTLRYENNT